MTETLPVPDQQQQLAVDADKQVAAVKDFRITSNNDMVQSASLLRGIKALQQKISDQFDPRISQAHKLHKDLVADKNALLEPLVKAETSVKRAVLGYQQDQERIRQEAEAKAQAAADAERSKLAAQAAEAEAKATAAAEKLRQDAEAAAAAGRTAEAAKLSARADTKVAAGQQKAAALQTRAAGVITPIIPSTVQKVAGMPNRKTFKAVVTDKMELFKGIVAGLVPIGAADANETFLNGQARLQKMDLNYPGVQVIEEKGITSRRGS